MEITFHLPKLKGLKHRKRPVRQSEINRIWIMEAMFKTKNTVFQLLEFKKNSLIILERLKVLFGEEKNTMTIVDIQQIWNSYAESECIPLYDYFMMLVNEDDENFYKIVPLATTIANFERLINVLITSTGNATVQEIPRLMPERHFDLLNMLNRLEYQISGLHL